MNVRGYYQAVRLDVASLLKEACLSDQLGRDLRLALASSGKILSPHPQSRWPLLAFLASYLTETSLEKALPVATAAELVGASTDLFDDLEDHDTGPLTSLIGQPLSMNAAFALLSLAGFSLTRVSPRTAKAIWQAIFAAADGQHLDLGLRQASSPDEYIANIDKKSGGLVAAFAAAGAMAAGCPARLVRRYAHFGLLLGRHAQLVNDLFDVWPGKAGKSDVQRRLVTLPILFLLGGPDCPERERIVRHLATTEILSEDEDNALRIVLLRSGALHYAWLKAESYHLEAWNLLRELSPDKAESAGSVLMPSLDIEEKLKFTR